MKMRKKNKQKSNSSPGSHAGLPRSSSRCVPLCRLGMAASLSKDSVQYSLTGLFRAT